MDKVSEEELERRRKIGETLRRKYKSGELVYNNPMGGKKHSPETIEKMKKSARERVAKGIALPTHPGFGKNHHWWKGGVAEIEAVHNWIKQHYGKPKKCEHCKTTTAKRFEWAKKEGCKYERKRENFMRLCAKCHRNYDDNANKGWVTRRKNAK